MSAFGDVLEGKPVEPYETWEQKAARAIYHLALTRPEFIAEEVWALVPRVGEPRRLGGVITKMEAAGIIEPIAWLATSRRPSRHGGNARRWRSLIYREQAA